MNQATLYALLLTVLCIFPKNVVESTSNLPLIYTRLRFDKNYLPLMKNLQSKFPYDEDELKLNFAPSTANVTNINNTQNTTFYVNSRFNLNNITEDDLILDALDQVYKTRLYQVFIQSYDKLEDRNRSSDTSKVSVERCTKDLNYIMEKFQIISNLRPKGGSGGFKGLNPELAAYFDSFASEEPGLLAGNHNWLGNWRQCSRRHIFDLDQRLIHQINASKNHLLDSKESTKVTDFKSRYCIAAIRSPHWKQKIINRANELSKNYFKYPSQYYEYVKFFRIQVGICLPESCDSSTIDLRNQDIRKLTMHKLREPFSSYELFDLYCLPDETSKLRQLDYSAMLLICVFISWLTLIFSATCADYYNLIDTSIKETKDRSFIQKIVFSMSLRENYLRLTKKASKSTTTSSSASIVYEAKSSDLRFLDAVKVIIMPSILLAHIGMIGLQYSKYTIDYDSPPLFMFVIQCGTAFYVDWYFCITAFITTYVIFSKKKLLTYNLSRWLYTIFHRYWRLAPSYVLFFWFCRSIFGFTSSGPLWDYGTTDLSGPRRLCKHESWLVPFTLTSNWHPLHRECVMPSWYISSDMQFYLMTPILWITLAKSSLTGWSISIALIIGSLLTRFYIYMTDIQIESLELIRPRADMIMRNSWDLPEIYLRPQYRMPSYLIGLLAGHYTYMVKSGQWKSLMYKQQSSTSKINGIKSGGLNINSNSNNDNKLNYNLQCSWRLRLCAWIGLCGALSMKLSPLLLEIFYPKSLESQARLFAAILYSSAHALAVSGPCLMFIAISFGYWQKARKFMELPVFTYIARVNYIVYLCQIDLIIWLISSSVQPLDIDGQEQLKLYSLCFPLIYFGAFLATLLIVNPLNTLESEFVGVHFENDGPETIRKRNIIKNGTTEERIIENGANISLVAETRALKSKEHHSKTILEQQQQQGLEATNCACKLTGNQFVRMIVSDDNDNPLQTGISAS